MSRRWLLRADAHWAVKNIAYTQRDAKALYEPKPETLCLMKALTGECLLECQNAHVRLSGSRMLLVDASEECRLREAGGGLELEIMEVALLPGYRIGDTQLQLCERYEEYRRFCYGEQAPLVFDDNYALILPLMQNLEAFRAFGLAEEREQLIHLYISYILLVIVCAAEEEKRFNCTGNRHVRRALRYIQQHFMGNISAADIAEHVGIHLGHLHRLFSAEMHTSINAYILDCRLSRVEFLLTHTDLSIAEIARVTGISSQQYLSRVFRERTGVSPGVFRQRCNITCVYDDVLVLREETP